MFNIRNLKYYVVSIIYSCNSKKYVNSLNNTTERDVQVNITLAAAKQLSSDCIKGNYVNKLKC
jgi:hypothetical protein